MLLDIRTKHLLVSSKSTYDKEKSKLYLNFNSTTSPAQMIKLSMSNFYDIYPGSFDFEGL